MDKIVMRDKEYKITSNENQYDFEVNGNTLLLKRGEQVYITLDLDKVCLGTKLEILKNVGIVLESTTGEQADIFEMWTEVNPGKTFDEFAVEIKRTLWKHSERKEISMVGIQEGLPIYAFVVEGMTIGTYVAEKRADVCYENITADLKPLRVTLGTPKEIVKKENATIEKNSQRKHELYKILSEEINDEFKKEFQKEIVEISLSAINKEIKRCEMTSENFCVKFQELTRLKETIERIRNSEIWNCGKEETLEELIESYNRAKSLLSM
ncbi:hypothetical protein [Cetobacterium sp.]|uniref:hypothetical protein n=1 Tax=Cetobacterium sp. TaxID=2071632 RepID=UPI003EE5C12A